MATRPRRGGPTGGPRYSVIQHCHRLGPEERGHANVFVDELEEALSVVAVLPSAGTPYAHADTPGFALCINPKIGYHIYFTFDRSEGIVRALWGVCRVAGLSIGPNLD